MYRILIVGAGQLGSRHLQGILKINLPINIEVYDINIESLNLSRKRAEEVEKSNSILSVKFIEEFNKISNKIDVVILATTSENRFSILSKLISSLDINNFILEKILFQNEEDYDKAFSLLSQKKINCWVNCPRRTYSIYQDIKEKIIPGEKIKISVEGKDWGLACNSIHFIDLFSFITKELEFIFDISKITQIINSKRNKYFEFIGKLKVTTKTGSSLELTSTIENKSSLSISIYTEKFIWEINELDNYANFLNKHNNLLINKIDFLIPFQSELSNIYVYDILTKMDCSLSTFGETYKFHQSMIVSFTKVFEKFHNYKYCQIT